MHKMKEKMPGLHAANVQADLWEPPVPALFEGRILHPTTHGLKLIGLNCLVGRLVNHLAKTVNYRSGVTQAMAGA